MLGANMIGSVELVLLLLLAFIVVFAVLAKKIDTPYPIVLVIAGLLLGFLPGAPRIPLNPDLIFLVVLPPLLYSAAWMTSWRDFRFNIATILLLAFGLVGFTVFGVALIAPRLLPGFDWQSAFVLGAVVSTTDAIAATSVGKKVGLPKIIMDILEGESLVNDASGLLALEFGIAMVTGGHVPTPGAAAGRLLFLVGVGLGIGLAIAFLVDRVERMIDDGPVEIGISLLVPYAAYLAAETVHASGVLAVIACGLYLSWRSPTLFSPSVRIQAYGVWSALTFLLNGFVFVMIGLQLPHILSGLDAMSAKSAIGYGLALSAVLIALRLLWTFPGAGIATWIRRRVQHQNVPFPPARQVFVVGWTGMRGVVALAAALSLPRALPGGLPFTQRNSIIFFTFIVILVTLVFQGLTLPLLIRRLGLSSAETVDCEEQEARRIVLEAALAQLRSLQTGDEAEFAAVYEDLEHLYQHRMSAVFRDQETAQVSLAHVERFERVSTELRKREREAALELRNQQRISDETWRVLERELDLLDLRLESRGG